MRGCLLLAFSRSAFGIRDVYFLQDRLLFVPGAASLRNYGAPKAELYSLILSACLENQSR
jgi:hypothetical protein